MVDQADVTLGEVWRNLQDLKTLVKDSFAEMKAELESQVDTKTATLKVRVDRIERFVYAGVLLLAGNLLAFVVHMITEMK